MLIGFTFLLNGLAKLFQLELVPLFVLAAVPSGYAWGLDHRLNRPRTRWPL